jgi:hypothetical protein
LTLANYKGENTWKRRRAISSISTKNWIHVWNTIWTTTVVIVNCDLILISSFPFFVDNNNQHIPPAALCLRVSPVLMSCLLLFFIHSFYCYIYFYYNVYLFIRHQSSHVRAENSFYIYFGKKKDDLFANCHVCTLKERLCWGIRRPTAGKLICKKG